MSRTFTSHCIFLKGQNIYGGRSTLSLGADNTSAVIKKKETDITVYVLSSYYIGEYIIRLKCYTIK